jgi:hypothetical protein
MTAAQLHTLLTAAAHLSLQPSPDLLAAAGAATRRRFATASLQELVLLLQGLTAFACFHENTSSVKPLQQQQQQGEVSGFQDQPDGSSSSSMVTCQALQPDESWWQAWLEASANRCAAISLAASLAGGAAAAARVAAYAFEGDLLDSSNSSKSNESDDSFDYGGVFGGAEELLQQEEEGEPQGGQNEEQQLTAGLLCDVCVVLLALQRPAHPLWLAGMLEAYLRCAAAAAYGLQLMAQRGLFLRRIAGLYSQQLG